MLSGWINHEHVCRLEIGTQSPASHEASMSMKLTFDDADEDMHHQSLSKKDAQIPLTHVASRGKPSHGLRGQNASAYADHEIFGRFICQTGRRRLYGET